MLLEKAGGRFEDKRARTRGIKVIVQLLPITLVFYYPYTQFGASREITALYPFEREVLGAKRRISVIQPPALAAKAARTPVRSKDSLI